MNGAIEITVTGNVVETPTLRYTGSGAAVCSMRVASTERYRDKEGAWADGKTVFLTVNCWRALAEHVADSVTQGDRVVVSGKLASRSFSGRDGNERTVLEVEAEDVGVSLLRNAATVTRADRRSNTDDPFGAPAAVADDPWATPVG